MTIEHVRRIIWRLREKSKSDRLLLHDVRRAIMLEVGLDERTIDKYIYKMIELGLMKRLNRWYFKDTGESI